MPNEQKHARDMTAAEFRSASAELCRPQPRGGIDLDALERITQGRKAGDLSPEQYRLARRVISQGDYR